jgi:hypothetical protein
MPEKFRHQVSQLRRAGEAPPAGPRRPAGAPANRDFRGEAGDAGIQPPSRRPAPAGLLRAVHSRGGPGGARNASRGVPVPLAFRAIDCESSPDQLAEELLALTKMNWNQTQLNTRKPITLETSKRVGDILRRLPAGIQPQARYAFYMQPRGPGRADPPALRRAQSLASISHAPRQCSPAGGVKFAAGLLFHGQVHERYTLGGNRAPAPIACPVPGQGGPHGRCPRLSVVSPIRAPARTDI